MIEASRLAFLGPGTDRLRTATVTVVGAGGGGSHIAQQLAHLAVGRLVIIDPDNVERSNVNRLVLSSYNDIGRPKAKLLHDRLQNLGGAIIYVASRAETDEARTWLEHSDVVLGAVDGVRARHNIETICRGSLVPYIDIGLKIDVAANGVVQGIGGQVFVSIPDGPCLRCAEIVTEEGMLGDREEYAVGSPDQQVIYLNGVLASQAVAGAVALLTGFAPSFPPMPLIRYDGLLQRLFPDRTIIGISCTHFNTASAGWRAVLPRRIATRA